MIRSAAAAAVGVAAIAACPAAADPVVIDVRFTSAEVRLVGADGQHWRLSLVASAAGAAHTETPTSGDGQELVVSAVRCGSTGCVAAGSWRIALRDDEITVARDYSSARLRTVLFGQRLTADLTPTGPESGTVRVWIGGVPAGPGDAFATAARVVHADGNVRIGSVTCSAHDAVIGEELRVAEELPAPEPGAAPRGLLDGSGSRCL